MKLPLSWLREWTRIDLPADDLSSRLTLAGFEVEGCTPAAPPFTGVIVAELLEAVPHPQADKLRVCKVSTGQGDALQIVCGAPNARAGLKVALAQVGAALPGDLKIKAAKLRGVESSGMLCSARELGLSQAHEGILELAADAPVGADLRGYLQLDDHVLEVSVYPNRGDAMSVLGLAREVSALLGQPVTGPDMAPIVPTSTLTHEVIVEAPDAAPRFLTRVLTGLDNTRTTPGWMQERLRRSGLRPISPIVDVTNYVMLELGQPLHAYERQRLQGAMRVRMARPSETLTLLDGRSVELQPDVLVIADEARAIGLAGVMGGEGTSITDAATDVVIEVAWFTPEAIVGRARRFGLQTDASQRFERGVDPEGQRRAMQRATHLLLSLCGGEAGPVSEFRAASAAAERPVLALRRSQLQRLTGARFEDAQVTGALQALQLPVQPTTEGWQVTPPSWRYDLNIEADLVEEVARIIGYDHIPETPALFPQRFRRCPESDIAERVLLDTLAGRGYQEAIHYAFVDPQMQARLFPSAASITLANPIAADLAVMRVSLWPGLLKGAIENQRRQHERVRQFELGTVFLREGEGVSARVEEPRRLAGIHLGPRLPEQWGVATTAADFHDLKSDVMALLALAGEGARFDVSSTGPACLHPGRAATVLRDGQPVAWLGELHPALVRDLDLPVAPLLFELDIAAATAHVLPKGRGVSRYPQVRRDLSVLVPESVTQAALLEQCRQAGGSLLREVRLFDVYQGKGVEPGMRSMAFGLVFQDAERTLTDEQVEGLVAAVADGLRQSVAARLRE
jgi:phenylalanyl-tRNA synthetase beta chain